MTNQDIIELENKISKILEKWKFNTPNDGVWERFYRGYTFSFHLLPQGMAAFLSYESEIVDASFSTCLVEHIFSYELISQEEKFVKKVIKDKIKEFINASIDKELFNQD